MGTAALNFTVSFNDTYCFKCQARFAVTSEAYDRLRKTHAIHWCPLCGQQQHFAGMSDEEKLRKELEDEKQRKLNILAEANKLREQNAALGRSIIAQRRETKKLRTRVKHGVCPCCTRTFANLAAHMETKHPEFKA